MRENLVWEMAGRTGLEHLQWGGGAPGKAESVLVANLDGVALNFRHVWFWDQHWSVKRVLLFVPRGGGQSEIRISVTPEGRWTVDDRDRPDLGNCLGVDIPDSPFPKIVLIHRLNLNEGEAIEVPVATLDVRNLQVVSIWQTWQRLAQRADGLAEYHRTADGTVNKYWVDDRGIVVLAMAQWRLMKGRLG